MTVLNMTMTPAADKFVRRMLRFDGGPMSGFSLSVARGGGSNLSSKFEISDCPNADETVFEMNGLRFFLQAESCILLQGVTMDFLETPTSAGFKFHNPANVSTCGTHGHDAPSLPESLHEH